MAFVDMFVFHDKSNIHLFLLRCKHRGIYPPSIKALYQDVKDETINYIKKSTIICLYGVSLGETDKDWWQLLGDWLQNDKKHLLIVFWYVPKGKETKK